MLFVVVTLRQGSRGALAGGLSVPDLDEWLTQRAGQPLSPAARLLAAPEALATFRLMRCVILQAPAAALADGLMQWPGTRALIRERLGPTALLVDEENVPALREAITQLGQKWESGQE